MKPRHARSIRAGIKGAQLVNMHPKLRGAVMAVLDPLGVRAFEEWADKEPQRMKRRCYAAIRKYRADAIKHRAAEHAIQREFDQIIHHQNWGK